MRVASRTWLLRPCVACSRGCIAKPEVHFHHLLCLRTPLTHLPPPTWRTMSQVIRSRDRLLDQLYTYLMSLKEKEIDALLAEDPSLIKRCVIAWG